MRDKKLSHMLTGNTSRRAEKSLYNEDAKDYIPLACHYDKSTLLTKNGDLIQILKISGIESNNAIAKNLNELRNVTRATLTANLDHEYFGCWIHTVRREKNLDDPAPYKRDFARDLHETWVQKNSIRKKFVSTLYISVVIRGIGCHLNSPNTLSVWNSPSTSANKHEEKLAIAHQKLTTAVNNILTDLTTYYPTQLSIRHEGNESYSDLLFVYSRILHFREADVLVPLNDFSEALAVGKYAVGWNQIEMKDGEQQSFSSLLSLRECHNSGDEGLFTQILQLPIEFVATEIFYSIDAKEARAPYVDQHYMLGVSKDEELNRSKGLNILMDPERKKGFCQQQLSMMVIANNVESLEQNTKKLSNKLSALGVVHVREDLNLENIFWSQLPGNFIFMRRATPGAFEDIGAFVSLQNAPTGRKRRKWGMALTILRTLHSTPYFVGFHNADQTGHTCIFGNAGSGKTVLMNFLISESTKHNPTIIYLGVDNKAKIFVTALGGRWYEDPVIPIKCNEDSLGVEILIDIISGQYSHSLSAEETAILGNLMSAVQNCASYDEAVNCAEGFDFTAAGAALKDEILQLIKSLKEAKVTISNDDVVGINLAKFMDLNNYNMRAAYVMGALRSLCLDGDSPKILVVDEMTDLFDHPYFTSNMELFLQLAKNHNIAVVGSIDTDKYINISEANLWKIVDANTDLKIVMHHKNIKYNLQDLFGITPEENDHLSRLDGNKLFLLKPKGSRSVIAELNVTSLTSFLRILSASSEDIKILDEVKADKGENITDWLPALYSRLEVGDND